jgi:predicted AlkP superfamily pyrophosphatase or phosphodiesterase
LFVYIPRLDYAPQKFGANAPQLGADRAELDALLGDLQQGLSAAYGEEPTWLVVGEYAMTDVNSVVYPNRILRELGTLHLDEREDREYLDPGKSRAFALCDHQFSHVFFNDADPSLITKVAERFRRENGIDEVLVGPDLAKYGLDHPRSGQIVLVSQPNSWQAYYFWNDNAKAPSYAGTVDIHRKPGYDPVELFFNRETMSVPLDATLIRGSHGAPVRNDSQKTLLACSDASLTANRNELRDVDVFELVRSFF